MKEIIDKIKQNKIINNAYIDILIYDYKEFDYKGKKYINIYFYSKSKYESVDVNNLKPIYKSHEKSNSFFECFDKKELNNDLRITAISKEKKETKINEFIKIDFNDYDFDENHIKILKHLNNKNINEYLVLPKLFEEYFICSCGSINLIKNDECFNCGSKREDLSIYSNYETIEKAYVLKEYNATKFNTKSKSEELKKFKERIFSNAEYELSKKYVTDDFLKKLFDGSDHKIADFIHRRKNRNQALTIITILLSIVVIITVAIIIIKNKNYENDKLEFIAKHCESTVYDKNIKDVKDLINNPTCSNIVNYLYENDLHSRNNKHLSQDDLKLLIDSNNKDLYKKYKHVESENLHVAISNYVITNITYLDYLYESKAFVSDDFLSDTMLTALQEKDKELFTAASKLYTKGSWKLAKSHFDSNYNNSAKEKTEFSLIYHKYSMDKNCYAADVYSVENIKYLITHDKYACHELMYKGNNEIADNFVKAGGQMKYTVSYGSFGEGVFNLVESFKGWDIKSDNVVGFEKILKLILKSGNKINEKIKNSSYNNGQTPLDAFLDDYAYKCPGYDKQGKSECALIKKYYKVLKKYGAKCNKKCYFEKNYFK